MQGQEKPRENNEEYVRTMTIDNEQGNKYKKQ
jgi:hypothetical protein